MNAIAVVRLDAAASDAAVASSLAALCAMLPRVGLLDRGIFACDLRGTARLLGEPGEVARRIVEACRRAGAPCAVGIASAPFVARVVAERSPLGEVREAAGDERAYLAPLPVAVLPLGAEMVEELALLGLRTIGAFAALQRGTVLDRFGHAAAAAHALAHGEDTATIHGIVPRRRIRARRRWDDPILSKEQLLFALRVTAEEIARSLAVDGMAALRVVLALEREATPPLRLERTLLPPTADPAGLLRSLRWALEEWRELGRVVGASLEAVEVEPLRGRQLGLFAPDGARREEALALAQHLRTRLGEGAVLRARVVDPDARLPEREAEWMEVVA